VYAIDWSGVDWGTFPDWVAAIGTALAFFGALYVYGHGRRADRRQRRRSQVMRVHVMPLSAFRWSRPDLVVKDGVASVADPESPAAPTFEAEVSFLISNTSDSPAYDVRVNLLDWSWQRDPKVLSNLVCAVLTPGSTSELVCVPRGGGL